MHVHCVLLWKLRMQSLGENNSCLRLLRVVVAEMLMLLLLLLLLLMVSWDIILHFAAFKPIFIHRGGIPARALQK
jgi:hypothetical protein